MRYGCPKITRCSEDSIMAAYGKMATHGIMPHGTAPNKILGQFEISREKVA
jgi:hypothetical protein